MLAHLNFMIVPPFCLDTGCPDPRSLVSNAEFGGEDTGYGNLVTISCHAGYYIRPGKTSITIACSASGNWNLDLEEFTCKS